ncbi:MAG TPA: hypothetical protein VE309_11715 [Caulobacteraceae bacterium]|nr:hypothetical protein [Caulobacteraceae bacterium]
MDNRLKHACQTAMALGLAAALASPVAAAAPRRFTFAYAEFLPNDEAMRQSQAFVAQALPPGLPMREAIARVERADMSCHGGRGQDGVVNCDFFINAAPPDGPLGENFWNLSLTPGPDGALQSVSLHRSHVGIPGTGGLPGNGSLTLGGG